MFYLIVYMILFKNGLHLWTCPGSSYPARDAELDLLTAAKRLERPIVVALSSTVGQVTVTSFQKKILISRKIDELEEDKRIYA